MNERAAQYAGEPGKNVPRVPQKYTYDRKTPGEKPEPVRSQKKKEK